MNIQWNNDRIIIIGMDMMWRIKATTLMDSVISIDNKSLHIMCHELLLHSIYANFWQNSVSQIKEETKNVKLIIKHI